MYSCSQGKETWKGKAQACSPEEEKMLWALCLGGFLSLAGRNFREGLRGGFQQNIHQFSRCALSGSQSLFIGQCQGKGS